MDNIKQCNNQNYIYECPILNTHDKLEEAHYFFHMMMNFYHIADIFRFNLNAFIQSLRHTTFVLQTEKEKIPNFDLWYGKKQEEMKSNSLLKKFSEGRTIVVHRGMLKIKSEAHIGKFRGRQEKMTMGTEIDPFADSEVLLDRIKSMEGGFFIDTEHSEINEQLGIMRTWIIEDLGEEEVVKLCYSAFLEVCEIIKEAHKLLNYDYTIPTDCNKDLHRYRVLLETDINPELVKKWGWDKYFDDE